MNIENLKEWLDKDFYINRHSEEEKISFRKYRNGNYRFFKGKTIDNMVIIEEKDWNVFLEKVKKEMEDK